ncbi:MAG: histidine phosphatase family protein [Lactobacillus sp.]|jgi:broad specificity phosphatase PhoE|nr:histidine phosphatase family protein [Lactobacillus sp.]
MRKYFYIFRHGETDLNNQGIWQARRLDIELNSKGEAQALELGEKLVGKGIEVIFSSPMNRAIRTAELANAKINVPILIKEGLIEADLGEVEGLDIKAYRETNPKECEMWFGMEPDNFDFAHKGAESKRQIYERFRAVLEDLLNEKYSVMGVSTHGAMIRMLLYGLLGRKEKVHNGVPYHIIHEDGEWMLGE